jgi:hypothetical protein
LAAKRTCAAYRQPSVNRVDLSFPGSALPDCRDAKPGGDRLQSQRRLRIGRFCGDFRWYRSALSVSGDTCGLSARFWPPVSASKNSVPRGRVFDGQIPVGCREFLGFGRPKATFRTRSVIIADSIQGLRTVGSILPEHHEVARLQYRVANDLRPRRGRDLVRGTRARSSC